MASVLKQQLIVWLIRMVQKYGPRKVRVLGRTYEVSEDVFNPRYYFTSAFMAKNISPEPDDIVLDMGTGSGIQAITAAQTASKVIATDINPQAVRFARENVRRSGVEDVVSVIEGDLFAPLDRDGGKFSVILFTPPYLQGPVKTCIDNALFDPGYELIGRFFREAGEYLSPGGYVQLLYSSVAGPEKAISIAGKFGWSSRIIAREKTFTEEFFIYKLTVSPDSKMTG